MELRALRYAVAVAEEGSVTGGAQRVHVSQPAVSRQIRALEKELGVTLFTRRESGVALTAAGRELVPLARDLLAREAFMRQAATSLAQGRLTALTVAAPTTTLTDVVAPFLATQGAGGPTVNVVARPIEEVFAALAEGADLVVATAAPPPGCASRLIADLPVRAYVGSAHVLDVCEAGREARGCPRSRRSRELSLGALAHADPLITLPPNYPVRQVLSRSFAREGLAPERIQEVTSPEAAQALAASGRGVAVLTNDPRYGLIPRRVVDAGGAVLTLPLYAAWNAGHHGADELADVASRLQRFCAEQYRDDIA